MWPRIVCYFSVICFGTGFKFLFSFKFNDSFIRLKAKCYKVLHSSRNDIHTQKKNAGAIVWPCIVPDDLTNKTKQIGCNSIWPITTTTIENRTPGNI